MSEREGKDLNEQIENNSRGIREMRKRRRKTFTATQHESKKLVIKVIVIAAVLAMNFLCVHISNLY